MSSGCASVQYTNQNLGNAARLAPGMNKAAVLNIMGNPIKTEFSQNVEEWHYCKTGLCSGRGCVATDEFVVLFFNNNMLVASRNYSVSSSDVDGALGSCELFIKKGNYREPEAVTELRVRVR